MLVLCFLLLLTVSELKAQPYVPTLATMGTLPESHEEAKTYDLRLDGGIPPGAKEVFLYVFVTTRGDGPFQRGYYELFTSHGKTKFTQFMNVATGQGVMAVNSANLWFPVGDGKFTVKLFHASEDKKRSIAGKREDGDTEWSGVFVIGYRGGLKG